MIQHIIKYMLRILWLLVLICVCCLAHAEAQVHLSSEEAEKLLLQAPEAEYPPIARVARARGLVRVEATISEAGRVTSARAITGHPLLQVAAVSAVKRYKYKPYTANGTSVSFTTEVYVLFPHGTLTKEQKEELERQDQLASQYFKVEPECKKLSEDACRELVRIADQLSDRALEKMRAHELLGHALARQKRYQEALDSFNRAFIPVKSVLTESDAELGRLYGNLAMTHHLLNDFEKALPLYRRAEKIYQSAYAGISKLPPDEFGEEMKKNYRRALRTLLEYHFQAAQEGGATAEVEEIKRLMKTFQ